MTWWAVGAAVVGSVISSDGARKAANTQADATRNAVDEQRRQADRTYADQQPFREAGLRGLAGLEGSLNTPVTGADVMQDPGYQFGLKQGQLALDRKAAMGGGRISGAALKSASEYGTNYASTGFNAAYQRKEDRRNRLAALAGLGQTATGASSAAGAQSANAISSLLSGQGDAAGAAQIARGNIWGGAVNQIGAAGQRYARQQPELPYRIDPNDKNAGDFFNGPGG